jgi:succinate-semialdehyde dehydrogenase/glutarate-semialdehyde dehydrogenase
MEPSVPKRVLASINPATGEVMKEIALHPEAEVERRLELATAAFAAGRGAPPAERAPLMLKAKALLEAEKGALARLLTLEMGKPLRAAVQEIEKCALACGYYARNTAQFMAEEEAGAGPGRSSVRYQPLGPVLAVMPWNFPFWQVMRFAAPGLMAGNVGLLKHASNVPQCALAIEDLFRRAGFAEGVFQTLLVGSGQVPRLIEDPRVIAVTLTGSVGAGASVAAVAGRQIKKTVLELGGSDPFIVMPSADLERAVAAAAQARTQNNGQSCIAAKRFIVHQRVADEFQRRFVERLAGLKVGDPMDETTDVGPLATADARDGLEAQVNQTVKMGARVLLGGRRLAGPGYFFEPTVLANIPPGSPADREELFGPVAALYRAAGMDEALRLANASRFGLGASAWTNDAREREQFIDGIEAGMAFVNSMVVSDPRLPFGGVKQSGYGRELGRCGLLEFVNLKTVVVQA